MIKDVFQKTIPNVTKSILIMVFCIIGFIFEFLVELPFLLILELHVRFGRKPHRGSGNR